MSRKDDSGYARGAETKGRILDVAIDLFGNRGFDGVTTREVAAAALVPPASLRYYFENKQGLYIACLEHVQERLFRLVEPALDAAELLLEDRHTTVEQLIESYCALQDARIDAMLGQPDHGTSALFTIRHDLPSESGAGDLSGAGTSARRMALCYLRAMIRISGGALDMQSALVVTGLINGEVMNICLRRNRLAEIGWDITPERLDWIKRTVRVHTRAILEAYRV